MDPNTPEKKIKGALPRPVHCDQCKGPDVSLEDNSIIYGRSFGSWSLVWYCHDCEAAVGCHPGTDIPLGRMADRQTRQARKRAHDAFDPIWKVKRWMKRGEAYRWLAEQLNISPEACHISWFDGPTCDRVVAISQQYRPKKAKRRK